MKRRRLIIAVPVTILILLSVFAKGDKLIDFLSDYLSKSEPVDANILLVEGWLPDYAIEKSCQEFRKNGYDHIITTGMNSSAAYFNIHSNGSLIFYTKKWFSGSDESSNHVIEVDAYSEPGGNGLAHFNLYLNDSPVCDFFAEMRKGKYRISWAGDLSRIDSVTVQFDNDSMNESGDRNLYVKSISADDKIIIPYLNNSVYDILKSHGHLRLVNNPKSGAESARVRLIMCGIDSSLIIAVPAKKVKINRTLEGALAFNDWLKTNKIEIKGINIISMGSHSRRTWMTYNKVLDRRYKIGVISVPGNTIQYSPTRMVMKIIREALGLIYYRIILIPY
jgi:hypothetical protein